MKLIQIVSVKENVETKCNTVLTILYILVNIKTETRCSVLQLR